MYAIKSWKTIPEAFPGFPGHETNLPSFKLASSLRTPCPRTSRAEDASKGGAAQT